MKPVLAIRDAATGHIWSSGALIPHCDLAASVGRFDLGDGLHASFLVNGVFVVSDPMPCVPTKVAPC